MFRAPLCPPSGAREYYTSGCCLSYLVLGFQVVVMVWSWGLCVRFAGCRGSPHGQNHIKANRSSATQDNPPCHKTRRFVTVLYNSPPPVSILIPVTPVRIISSYTHIFIVQSHLSLCLSSWIFASFVTRTVHYFFGFFYVLRAAHVAPLNLKNLTLFN
jgi:hypothetical protein